MLDLARAKSGGSQPWTMSRLLNRLRQARGGMVTMAELIDAAYGEDAEGGPDNAANAVSQRLHQLRKKGFPIVANGRRNNRGYRYVPEMAK